MSPDEYRDKCDEGLNRERCWMHWKAVTRQWKVLFPQRLYDEPVTLHYRIWDLYVEWTDDTRGKVNRVSICHKHSYRLWLQWGEEGAEELATSDAFEAWSIENEAKRWLISSRSTTSPVRLPNSST